MKELALSVNGTAINPPQGIPTGGLSTSGVDVMQVAYILLFVLGDVLALAFVIYAGIQWTMSGGDKQKIQAARNRLIYSIVGLIVISMSFFIVQTVIKLLFL